MDLFQLLSSSDVNWWTGVVWIIVMFLSDSHSDGTHSLQSIHCWDTFLQIWLKTNTSRSYMAWRRAHFNFWMNYFFKALKLTSQILTSWPGQQSAGKNRLSMIWDSAEVVNDPWASGF